MSAKLHLEILDKNRQAVFPKLQFLNESCYLARGTALALQINHRLSYDFDLFCHQVIGVKLIKKCQRLFTPKQVLINTPEEFTFLTPDNIKITLLYYPFHFPGKFVPSTSIPLLSIQNIITSKAYALHQRATYRDYFDIYFVMRYHGLTLQNIINQAQKVYAELFSPKLFLGQLLYLEDIPADEKKSVVFIQRSVSAQTILRYFREQVSTYQKGIIKN